MNGEFYEFLNQTNSRNKLKMFFIKGIKRQIVIKLNVTNSE